MKWIIVLACIALSQAKPQVPHDTYGVPDKFIVKPFEKYEVPVVSSIEYGVPAPAVEIVKLPEEYSVPHAEYGLPLEEKPVPIVETKYSYTIPEALNVVIPTETYGPPAVSSVEYGVPAPAVEIVKSSEEYGLPAPAVEIVKPAEEYGVPHKEYGLPLEVKPTPIVETKYSYTIPEAPKVVVPAETYGVPAVPAVEYGVPAPAVEIVKPAVPHEEYGLPLEEKPAPVVETNYAYTIPVEEPKPVTPAAAYGVPQKEYGLPLVEEKPYAPAVVIPHETYGVPNQYIAKR